MSNHTEIYSQKIASGDRTYLLALREDESGGSHVTIAEASGSSAESGHAQVRMTVPADALGRLTFALQKTLEYVDGFERKRGSRREPAQGNRGSRWEPYEEDRLLKEFDAGTGIPEIANAHDRTAGAIEARLVKLGRLVPNFHEPNTDSRQPTPASDSQPQTDSKPVDTSSRPVDQETQKAPAVAW